MINAIFVLFFQAAAGVPATPPVEPVAPATAPAAAPAAPEAPAAAAEPAADPNRKICRNISVVGSRVPVRQCRTAAEEDAERAAGRRWLERAQSQMPTNAN